MGPRYIARKAFQALLTIAFVVLLNFILFRSLPGSPDRVLLRNPNVSNEERAELRAKWGIDDPLLPISFSGEPPFVVVNPQSQLVAYLEASAAGDFGVSFANGGRSVVEVIGAYFWPTMILIGLAELIAIVVGLALGSYSGWRRGSKLDQIGNGASLILYSMPYFVIGMPLIIIFAVELGWFPTSGMLTPGAQYDSFWEQLLDFLHHLVLPVTTVSLGLIGGYSILMRLSIIETRTEDYVTTARAKGLEDRRILRSHAFPNALLPTVTVIAINLGYVVAGAITAEIVFNWPGLGTLTVDALQVRDYPVLQGIFLLVSIFVIVANFGADLIYTRLDPRVRV